MDKAVLSKMKDGQGFSVDELLINRGAIVEEIDLRDIDIEDRTFAVHDADAALDSLSESLARDGQIDPIIVRKQAEHWQLVDGFRRVAAAERLGLLHLKARRFDALSATEAALFVVKNITAELPYPDALHGLAARLQDASEPDAAAAVLLYAARISVEEGEVPAALSTQQDAAGAHGGQEQDGQEVEIEVTPDELADQVCAGFAALSEDLHLVQENWADLDQARRTAVLQQLRYYAQLHAYLNAGEPDAGAAEA